MDRNPLDRAAARARFVERLTRGQSLARTLQKHHITGIAISGTIGAGLFITCGEIIGLAGSLGSFLAYLVAGIVVVCVMLCLSEMVSVRPVAGALFEFPKLYVDPALGFATGLAYWMAYTFSSCTLTVSTAMLLGYWDLDMKIGIVICLIPMWAFNFFSPVLWYGNLEWTFKWLKLLLVVALTVLMVAIVAGLTASNGYSSHGKYWSSQTYLFPPGLNFSGWDHPTSVGGEIDIPGSTGAFLGFWTATTMAVFAFIGVEIVIITAGEAAFPRYDLPIASRWIYIFAVVVYSFLALFASLNVPYNDPALLPYSGPDKIEMSPEDLKLFPHSANGVITTGERSPFIIAVIRAGYTRENSALPGFINACLVFAALTAANTAFYVASRTLYALCKTSGVVVAREYLGKTSYAKLPLLAITFNICLSAFAFLGAIKGAGSILVGIFSRISVTSILCVYLAECIAFIRFMKGMRECEIDRDGTEYKVHYNWYRSPGHQPLPAIVGIIMCFLLIIFNGWETFYRIHHGSIHGKDIAIGLIRAYLGPVLFLTFYLTYKLANRTRVTNYQQFSTHFNPDDDDIDAIPLEYRQWWRRALAEAR